MLFSPRGSGQLWCANVGNSRAVIALLDGTVQRLSVEHTPAAPEEAARVMASGGSIELGQLDGDLEVCRSLGDFDFACAQTPPARCLSPRCRVPRCLFSTSG